MCGISGFFSANAPVSTAGYLEAHGRIAHRGQDDEGFVARSMDGLRHYRGDDSAVEFGHLPHLATLSKAQWVLGHRRLSILDLSAAGHQPMVSANERYVMVYNGEIYNYLELRKSLERQGHTFYTGTDSEVVLKAYEQFGVDCFATFNGMWAVAIIDNETDELLLCRDRFGIKPLYYHKGSNGELAFASEAKVLRDWRCPPRIHEQRAREFIAEALIDHHEQTLLEGISQVRPGTWMKAGPSGIRKRVYWQVQSRREAISETDAVDQLDELLTSAVELRLRSDVPVGSLLSGGLDSTTIVCLVRKILDDRRAENDFEFFSAVFDEEAYSERKYIEKTVEQTKMPVHWVTPDPERLEATLPQLLFHQDFPFRSLAVYSQWSLMEQVRRSNIVVLLNGQGSDEIFGGYGSHNAALAAEQLGRARLFAAWKTFRCLVRTRDVSPKLAALMIGYELLKQIRKPELPKRPAPRLNRPLVAERDWPRQTGALTDRLAHDLCCSAMPEYLRYEDRTSMAFTLESRLPFLDYRLVEWAFTLPSSLRITGASSKHVLRRFAEDLIPSAVVGRTDKMGFVSPQELWQKDILADVISDKLTTHHSSLVDILSATGLKAVEDHQRRRSGDWAFIWRLYCYLKWTEALVSK